jgi:hypothetical protein
LCFRNENNPSEINDSDFKEDKLPDDLVKFKGDQSKDWLASLHTVFISFFEIIIIINPEIIPALYYPHGNFVVFLTRFVPF